MKKIKVSRKTFEALDKQLEEIKAKRGEGLSTREFLMEIYRENLPDKNDNQAMAMADEAIQGVTAFYRELDEAMEDKDAYIDSKLREALQGQGLRERCETLVKYANLLRQIHLENVPEEEKDGKEPEEIKLPDEVTDAVEAELTALVKSLMASYTFLSPLTPEGQDIFSAVTEDGDLDMLVDAGQDRINYLAAISMLAYVNMKAGNIPGAPGEITMRQVTAVTCATAETVKAAAKVEEGWAEAMLSQVLGAIGVVTAAMLAGNVAASAMAVVFSPVGLITTVCSVFLGYCGVKALIKGAEWWQEDCTTLSGYIVKAGRVVKAGLKSLFTFAREKVVPRAWAMTKQGVSKLLSHFIRSEVGNAGPDSSSAKEEEEEDVDEMEKTVVTDPA